MEKISLDGLRVVPCRNSAILGRKHVHCRGAAISGYVHAARTQL